MQSTDIKEIKAVLWDQAFIGWTRVSCPMGGVVAIRKRKGQLLALIYGWGRWYSVKSEQVLRRRVSSRRVCIGRQLLS